MEQVLRKTKCFACFYGDAVSEKEFYIKNFKVCFEEKQAVFSLELIQALDFGFFEKQKLNFDTFLIEDSYLSKQVTSFLKAHPALCFFSLQIKANTNFKFRISRIKLEKERLCLYIH